MALSDRVAVMSSGKVAQEGTPADIYHHPVNRFVANFIGESNFFQGKVVELESDRVVLDVPGFARPILAPLARPVNRGQQVTVMVRPEQMIWRTEPNGHLDNVAEAVVRKVAFLGMYTQLAAELADGSSAVIHQTGEARADSPPQQFIGQRVYVGWRVPDGQVLVD
jgi:ABC-type Fe3+/spermidine/putrescine transport system ATPase subunit